MISKYFDIIFSLYNNTPVKSGGATKPGRTLALEGQQGRLDFLTGKEIQKNERNEITANYMLFCGNIDIKAGQIVVIDNQDYEVYSVDKTTLRGKYNAHLEVYLLKSEL